MEPSPGGTEIQGISRVIRILERADIACCLVGVSALKYFGAWRVRDDWEICVPTDMVAKTAAIFKSEPYTQFYETCPPGHVQPFSLLHTFPRFKVKETLLRFAIVPSEDCHLTCKPSNIERSQTGLPYPKLEIFAQSLLETYNEVALTDLIDGMNLTEEWGLRYLDLDGTTDLEWTENKNEKIRSSVPLTETSCFLELPTASFSLRDIWGNLARTKSDRIDSACAEGGFSTRFYPRNQGDPRLLGREDV
ncbi:hypothetical protein FQN54_008606 [Arachnomyces sp. PD_36]|nr:hypothetical protein FQN54_008606 [Arachnomyces sp. PD_36]